MTGTTTRAFGSSTRENHDASAYYRRMVTPIEDTVSVPKDPPPSILNKLFLGDAADMAQIPDGCVALAVTSPPYHDGKEYDTDGTFDEYLEDLRRVFAEVYRVLEPGGRFALNVAGLGRRPYLALEEICTAMCTEIGQDAAAAASQVLDVGSAPPGGWFNRGKAIWIKGEGSGSTTWGSFCSPSNPVLRDLHEFVLFFSKGRFDRHPNRRRPAGDPTDVAKAEFMDATLSIWKIRPESAKRIGHPAPFPVELPERIIRLHTWPGELVLDPYMGSGSTAVAAVQTGRKFVGYDNVEEYVAKAQKRVDRELRRQEIEAERNAEEGS